jgi:hypothetical protein
MSGRPVRSWDDWQDDIEFLAGLRRAREVKEDEELFHQNEDGPVRYLAYPAATCE